MDSQFVSKLFLISTILFSTIFHSSLSELCNPQDKKVLLQIKQAFNNPHVLSSWDPHSDCCRSYYCVKCDDTSHRINSLTVSGGLSGEIPQQIGELPYLETLVLIRHENLRGPIPPAIAKPKRLSYLSISWTNVSGPVPGFLSQLTSLLSLDLSFNGLTGLIPSSLSRLPSLNSLHLGQNKLTGPIPDSFGEFQGMDEANKHRPNGLNFIYLFIFISYDLYPEF